MEFKITELLSEDDMKPEKISLSQPLGSVLLDSGRLSIADIDRILQLQSTEGVQFGEAGVKLGLLSESDVQHALAKQYAYPYLVSENEDISKTLIAAYSPFDKQTELLRILRSELIRNRRADVVNKALAVVSPDRKEGRSFLAANLAITFAQLGQRTLLIDADLRNPTQHSLFKLENNLGLSSLLAGRSSQRVIRRVKKFDTLFVLTAGPIPPNPQELLGKSELPDLLRTVSNVFDVVLIDTSSAADSADSHIVASCAGSAMIVTRKNYSSADRVNAQVKKIVASGIHLVGSTLSEFYPI